MFFKHLQTTLVFFENIFQKIFDYIIRFPNFANHLAKHFKLIKNKIMIIIPIKEGENIERALKKFKRKFEKTGVIRELRSRQAYKKPSVVKREALQHAQYIQKLATESDKA